MKKGYKKRELVHVELDPHILDCLQHFSKSTNVSVADAVKHAVGQFCSPSHHPCEVSHAAHPFERRGKTASALEEDS